MTHDAEKIIKQLTRIADAMGRMAEIAAIEARRDAGMALADDREYLSRIRHGCADERNALRRKRRLRS